MPQNKIGAVSAIQEKFDYPSSLPEQTMKKLIKLRKIS